MPVELNTVSDLLIFFLFARIKPEFGHRERGEQVITGTTVYHGGSYYY